MRAYFWPERMPRDDGSSRIVPVFPSAVFRRRFRKSRALFDHIFAGVTRESDLLRAGLNKNATGRLGASPLRKVMPAMGQLVENDVGVDSADEYRRLGESTALKSVKELCDTVMKRF